MLKRELAQEISNARVDQWYEQGRAAGAVGGKLLGAGGGGFLMFYAPPEKHPAIERALHELRRIDFRMDPHGSKVILYQPCRFLNDICCA
jgi:D-glycero-alpha-D-manno-heptose-7-phosphate kinase